MATSGPNAFAEFIRTVGRGPGRSRALEQAEAERAMAMILGGEALPVQVGAFLVLMRYRKETPEELAGFVCAARAAAATWPGGPVLLDWPSYADNHRQQPYFLLAALLLAENGVTVLMHGLEGSGSATTRKALAALSLEPAASPAAAAAMLAERKFAYLPIAALSPAVAGLFGLRPVLGLRSPANTFCRMLNPAAAPASIAGVFHPTYLATHQETGRLLDQPRLAVFKGGGGEAQRNPDKPCRVATLAGGIASEETWPAMLDNTRHDWRAEPLGADRLLALWRGELGEPAPHAAVVATTAVAWRLLDRAGDIAEAERAAHAMWQGRDRHRFG
jgi:anthranilate phosphoribosyltransferase